jgi:hypothetical protein
MDIAASPLDIYAVVSATGNFKEFRLEYGIGNNPGKWKTILKDNQQHDSPTKLVTWDVYEAGETRITLRIYITSSRDTFAEKRIHLDLVVPTLTPTISPTVTETQQPTNTATLTPTDTSPAGITPTLSDTPIPSETPVPSATPTPTP